MPELNNTILKNSANLKAYYRLESGALTTDSSGNGYTLTNNNSVGEAAGLFGGAADFGAANTNKSLVTSTNLGISGAAARSVTGWVNFSATPSNCWLFTYGEQADNKSFSIRVQTATAVQFNVWGFDDIYATVPTISTGTWHQFSFIYDGSTLFCYWDGICVGQKTVAINTTNSIFIIGRRIDSTQWHYGLIDDLAIFTLALSADQIKEIYEGRIYGELRPNQFGAMKAIYHLNSNSTDFSGNNNHGVDTDITYSAANGKLGKGAGFNGSSSKIVIADSASLDLTSWSVGGWFNTNSVGLRVIIGKFKSGSNDYSLYVDLNGAGGKLRALTHNAANTSYVLTGNTVISTNVWHHVVAVYDTSTLKLYLDGNLDNSMAVTGNSVVNSYRLKIGCREAIIDADEHFFDGELDEMFVTSVLTANQIRQIYAYQKGLLGKYA